MGFYNPGTAPNNYLGTWNASTNSPTLASSVGPSSPGSYYVVSVSGTTNLNGISDWTVGDWVIWSGSVWQKLEGGATTVTVGSTNIASGTTGRLLYDNAGVLGEFATTISGSDIAFPGTIKTVLYLQGNSTGNRLYMDAANNQAQFYVGTTGFRLDFGTDSTMKVFARDGTTQAAVQAGTLALGGATIGSNALAVTGTSQYSAALLAADGTSSAPSYSFSAATGTGFYRAAANQVVYATNAHLVAMLSDNIIRLNGNTMLGWASAGNDPTGSQAVGFGFPTSGLITVDGSVFGNASSALGLTKLVGGGGFTASFPMWKRNATAWNARLADDSADAAITTAAITSSGIHTITQATANTGIIASTGYSLTGTDATSMINLAGTWNTTGVPTAIKLNITNTASGAGSLLMDLQVGAASKFSVDTVGNTSIAGSASFNTSTGSSSFYGSIALGSARVVAWGSGSIGSTDTGLSRISAGVVGFGNGTAANISGGIQAATLALGGATIGSNALAVTGTGTFSGELSTTGGSRITSGGDFRTASASYVYWANRSIMSSPSDGIILLQNTAATDFTRLQFGGTTSSFPSIKRNAAALDIRLADDSDYASVTLKQLITTTTVSVGAATAITAGGNTGTRLEFTSTSGFGIYVGSGAPTISAAKGSLYLRSDGTTTNDRAYINTNGSTTWTALTTAA